MGKQRLIFDARNLEDASAEMLIGINKAVLAAAFKIRDEMREEFKKSASQYKYGTEAYQRLAEGIMVGKLNNGQVKIHALGTNQNDGTWKARFFVGGTTYRKNQNGNKGYIKENSAVDKGIRNAESILTSYLNNVLNN